MATPKTPPSLLLLLFALLLLLLPSTAATRAASSPSPSPTSSPALPPPVDRPGPSALDPRQLSALQSLGFPAARDPCSSSPSGTGAGTGAACDGAAPFRHVVSLALADCGPDAELSPTVLRALSTLRSLSLARCPRVPPPRRAPPAPLAASLRSFSCSGSLRRLPGLWVSRLRNLTLLSLVDVPVLASAPSIVISQMPHLLALTLSRANLSGPLPHHWHCLRLAHLDLSSNRLAGPVPTSVNLLASLRSVDLSSNSLSGPLPDSLGDLLALRNVSLSNNSFSGPIPASFAALSALARLDLSSNQFNGSIPASLAELRGLRVLNLENNNFQGVIPFNASFVARLESFKVRGNANLCYNKTLLSPKLKLGVAPCDRYGLPVSPPPPPPQRATRSDSSDYAEDGGDGDDNGGGKGSDGGGRHGPNRLVLGVAIGLSCLVFLVIFLVCLSKVCG
uniref:Receptor-like protein 51 n=1 Tax=Puya raimondii TaxID=112807 RepID=A0A8A0WGI8_PUYRA|nr:receptor-like protein 51 [Puya raimondii]